MADADSQVQKVKTSLENWREIILPLNSVLSWEKQWHPCALVGGSTILFMSIWLSDPSLLTTLSILGLTLTISDYAVPLITASMVKADAWSEKKEKEFEDVCRYILKSYITIKTRVVSFYLLRTAKPKLYYGCTVISLLLLAWIGNNINNLLLTYLLATLILLAPGMERTGILYTYAKLLSDKITDMAFTAKLKVAPVKEE